MNPASVSLMSTLANLALTIAKTAVGLLSHSLALTAEGIHSALDVVSSFVTFLGIRAALRPADTEHPFGHERYESVASMVVVFLLMMSGAWILYEAVSSMVTSHGRAVFTIVGLVVMGISAIVNEISARAKLYTAVRNGSLALTADAEHSRADVVTSVAVFIGLFAVRYLPLADSLLAALVAAYIFFEVIRLSKHTLDSLVDRADLDLEKRIRSLLDKNGYAVEEITTRQAGKARFASVSISYDPRARLAEVTAITRQLESELMSNFPELKQVTINVTSHGYRESFIGRGFGKGFRFHQSGRKPIVAPKTGMRVAIPVEDGEIAPDFGAREYLIVDFVNDGSVVRRELVQNPYYRADAAHGAQFVKSAQVDRVMAKRVGGRAKENLLAQGIAAETVDGDTTIEGAVEIATSHVHGSLETGDSACSD